MQRILHLANFRHTLKGLPLLFHSLQAFPHYKPSNLATV